MGCDIHFHSEVKRGGIWHHHSEKSISRNYVLFAKMAGVRNYDNAIKPISIPKGMPKDAIELTRLHAEKYGADGHSHSWLSAQEIWGLHKFIRSESNPLDWFGENPWWWEHQNMPYFMGNHMDGFVEYPLEWAQYGIEDVRYIFFFDN